MTKFNAIFLKLARDQQGLSQCDLAKRLDVKQAVLSKYENGAIVPPDDMLDQIAYVLNYPKQFFFQDGNEIPSGLVFHRKRSSLPAKICHKVEAEVRARSLDVLRMFRRNGFSSDVIAWNGQSPVEMACLLRRYWNVGTGPIKNLTELLETHRIVVLSFDFKTDKLDGFFMPIDDGIIAIALNDNDAFTMDRRRHTLAHELGHAVLNHCNRQFPGDVCEKEADAFAAELLTPNDSIKPELKPTSLPNGFKEPLTPDRFRLLKAKWGVSMGSLLYRAHELDLVKDFGYRRMWMHFSSLGYRRREPDCGIPMEHPKLLNEMLSRFIEEVENPLDVLCLNRKGFEERYPKQKGVQMRTT